MSQLGAIFLWDNYAWDATATASTTATGLDASAVVNMQRGVFHRTTVDTASWWQLSFPAGVTPTCFAAIDHNFTSGWSVHQLRTSVVSDFSSANTTLVSSITWREGILFETFANVGATRYFRLDVTNSTNPSNYLQLGTFMLGVQFEPTDSFEFGYDRQYQDLSEVQVAINGARTGVRRAAPRVRPLSFPVSTKEQLALWEAMVDAVGITRPFVAALDRTNRPEQETLYCTFGAPPTLPNVYGPDINGAGVVLLEAV